MSASADTVTVGGPGNRKAKARRLNRFDSPWLNAKFIVGTIMVVSIALMGIVGQFFWPVELSYPASSPLNLPPPWAPGYEYIRLAAEAEQVATPVADAATIATPGPAVTPKAGTSLTGGNPFAKPTDAAPAATAVTTGEQDTSLTPTAASSTGTSLTGGNPFAKPTNAAPAATTPDATAAADSAAPAATAVRTPRANPYGFGIPSWEHPMGTESNGRDMLAVLLVGAPRSLWIGLIAASIGMLIGIILGFTAGYMGGWVDAVIRTLSDSIIVIPALAVLIVIAAYVRTVSIESMALLLALFAWPAPTRFIRAQVLSMRERGYVNMARISGASSFDIMFKEMMPNMLPYLAASFTGNVSGAILAASSLEALGLGP
ncbi:MAG: ABC transporter permease, partial [Caldilinea sp.]|nr:ABC transporter permease [Caldilinea sp.]